MVRPRWHDALIIGAIVVVFSVGVWALWWEDVRGALGLTPAKGSAEPTSAPVVPGST
jgi:hypothetical protein